jgi:hypothetical protein
MLNLKLEDVRKLPEFYLQINKHSSNQIISSKSNRSLELRHTMQLNYNTL